MSDRKITILTLGDHPMYPSGVGNQTKQVCEALLDTGKFTIMSMGGAMDHESYDPVMTEKYREDCQIPINTIG